MTFSLSLRLPFLKSHTQKYFESSGLRGLLKAVLSSSALATSDLNLPSLLDEKRVQEVRNNYLLNPFPTFSFTEVIYVVNYLF